jgi:hypothetical protein
MGDRELAHKFDPSGTRIDPANRTAQINFPGQSDFDRRSRNQLALMSDPHPLLRNIVYVRRKTCGLAPYVCAYPRRKAQSARVRAGT